MRQFMRAVLLALLTAGLFVGLAAPAVAGTVATSTLTLTGPSSAPRAQELTLDGTLTSGGAPLAAATLQVSKTDLKGSHTLPDATTAGDGSYSVTDTPLVGGTVRYTVSFAGDATHGPASKSIKVNVSRSATTVKIKTNRARYAYNKLATVTAHLGNTYSNRKLSIYAKPYGHARKLLKTAKVNSNGNLTVTKNVTLKTTFIATFSGDERWAPASASTHVLVHAHVRTAVAGVKHRDGKYRVYSATDGGAIAIKVSPNKAGKTVKFVLQVRRDGAWRQVDSDRETLNSSSVIAVGFWGNPDHKYRIRGQWGGDAANLAQAGKWQYAEFV